MAPEDLRDERWAPHPVYTFYDVSDQGRVRTWRNRQHGRRQTPVPMMAKKLRGGYLCVKISHDRRGIFPTIHRLVLEAFVGACPDGMQACHHNGNREDNRLENLRWDTPKNNYLDRVRHGTVSRHKAVFTDDQVRNIRALVASGIRQVDLARQFGVTRTCINYIVKRKAYAHVGAPGGVSSARDD